MQAHALGSQLQRLHFDRIYSSPLIRAKETADIFNEYLQTELVLESALQEVRYGSAEGMVREDYRRQYAARIAHVRCLPFSERIESRVITDGESVAEVVGRVLPFLNSLVPEWMGKNLLIVCHGGVIRSLLIYLYEKDNYFSIENAGYVVLEWQEGSFRLTMAHRLIETSQDDTRHLIF